jgi:hypothetical protein
MDAAEDFGIDLALLQRHLEWTPAERIRQLVATQRFNDALRARTLTPQAREELDRMELEEKRRRLGS